jgi:hypothetical protein
MDRLVTAMVAVGGDRPAHTESKTEGEPEFAPAFLNTDRD